MLPTCWTVLRSSAYGSIKIVNQHYEQLEQGKTLGATVHFYNPQPAVSVSKNKLNKTSLTSSNMVSQSYPLFSLSLCLPLSSFCALNISFQSLCLSLWCVIFIPLSLSLALSLSLTCLHSFTFFFVLVSKRFYSSTPPSNPWWQCRPNHLFILWSETPKSVTDKEDCWNIHVASFKKQKKQKLLSPVIFWNPAKTPSSLKTAVIYAYFFHSYRFSLPQPVCW